MVNVLLNLGGIKIYSFGVMALLGVVLGLFVIWKKAQEYHLEDNQFFDLMLGAIFWGLVTGRVFYIIGHWPDFGFNVIRWLWLTQYVGISFWGSLMGLVVAVYWVTREENQDWFKWLDLVSLGLAVGLVMGKVGQFLNGVSGWPCLPLVEAGVWAGIAYWLWWLEHEYRTIKWYRAGKSSAQTGFLWFWWLICLGIVTGGVNALVQDWKVWLSVIAILIGAGGIYWRSGRSLKTDWLDLRKRFK